MGSMEFDWGRLIVGQLEFYWDVHLRPRLDGLTDEEYLWEPVKDAVEPAPPAGRQLRPRRRPGRRTRTARR